jgi:hypothetical protein
MLTPTDQTTTLVVAVVTAPDATAQDATAQDATAQDATVIVNIAWYSRNFR